MPRKIEISHKTIIFTVLFLIFLWFLFIIRDIILQLFVAILIMTILTPLVTKLSELRIPRTLSVVISYLIVFGIFGVALAGVIPPLADQTSSFAAVLPRYLENLGIQRVISDQISVEVLSQLGSLPAQIVKISISVFSNILILFIYY